MSDLASQSIQEINKDSPALHHSEINTLLASLDSWLVSDNQTSIIKDFYFKNYYQSIAFVNAVAWIANQTDHHPDLEVGYNHCLVKYSTHAIGGLSINDFICAARIDKLDAE